MSTISCTECGSEVDTEFNYCPECGSEVEFDRCPECDAVVPVDADACSECGSRFDVTLRGPDVDDVTDAVRSLDADTQQYLTEAIRRDPALVEAWAQLVGIAPDPEDPADDQPQYVTSIRTVLDDSTGKDAADVAEELRESYVEGRDNPLTDYAEVPDDIDAEWVEEQLQALVERGAIGRYTDRDGKLWYVASVGGALGEEMSLSGDKTLDDVDRVIEDTGMDRAVVLRRNMNAQYTDLVVE